MGKISVTNLRQEAIIGINPEERSNKQEIKISYSIEYDSTQAEKTDDFAYALDYKKINKRIIGLVQESSFFLLETLTAKILELITEDERVLTATVTVDKGTALRYADSVAFTLEHKKS